MFKQMLVCNEKMRVVELLRSYYAHVTAPIKVCRECTSAPQAHRRCQVFRDIEFCRLVYFYIVLKIFFQTFSPGPQQLQHHYASASIMRGLGGLSDAV